MKTRLEDISNKDLLQNILSIKDFDLRSKISFLRSLSFEHYFSIWKIRSNNNPKIQISDSLIKASKVYKDENCVLAYIQNEEVMLILFLDNDRTMIYGYVSVDLS